MNKYCGNNKPYTYVSFPQGKKEQALSILEKLSATEDGKKLCFWYNEGNTLTKQERKRIATASSLLIFADGGSLGDERFRRTVDAAVDSQKGVLCVHLEPLAYDTPWAKMQLGAQQAISRDRYDDEDSLVGLFGRAEIFENLRVTKEQKRAKRRQMMTLVSTPIALAAFIIGALFATGVLPPKDGWWFSSGDAEEVIHIPDTEIYGTAAELAKIKQLAIVGNYSFTGKYDAFWCDPVLDGVETSEFKKINWSAYNYSRVNFYYNNQLYNASRGKISDLSFLEYFPNLEVLIIAGQNVTDISPVFKLEKLKILFLNCNRITSVKGISVLKNLREAYFSYNTIKDTADLFECKKLCQVGLEATGISELGTDNVARFQWIGVADTYVSHIPPMGVNMDWVSCSIVRSNVTDCSFLKKAYSYGCIIADGPVKDTLIPAIKGKYISEFYWQNSDVTSLSELEEIKLREKGVLEFGTSDIKDLHGAEKIKGLKKLGLFGCNNLKNLDGLEKAESLEVVGVDMDLAQKVRKLSSETGKKYVIIDYADYTIQGANYDDARGSWEDEYEILD